MRRSASCHSTSVIMSVELGVVAAQTKSPRHAIAGGWPRAGLVKRGRKEDNVVARARKDFSNRHSRCTLMSRGNIRHTPIVVLVVASMRLAGETRRYRKLDERGSDRKF